MIELNGVRDALATLTAHAPRFYRAPGRVNLIGDHVDYSEGFVLPIAIDRMTVLAAAPRDDRVVRMRSVARSETVEFSLDDPDPLPRLGWTDDVRRIALGLERRGATLCGTDIAVRTTIPRQAGLAASAALGLAGALALIGTAGGEMTLEDVVTVCREIDGEVAPIASAMGKRDHALLIDCRSGEATTVPLALTAVAIVVCDSHVVRDHAALERQRHGECDEAAKLLRGHLRRVAGQVADHDVRVDECCQRCRPARAARVRLRTSSHGVPCLPAGTATVPASSRKSGVFAISARERSTRNSSSSPSCRASASRTLCGIVT